MSTFTEWFRKHVTAAEVAGEHLEDDVKQYAQPPERYATTYRQMYSYGMHLRVRGAETRLVTRDSCVVASFTRQLCWEVTNGRPIERTDDYVGYIEEILELDYRNHCTTLLVCDWVKGCHDARYANIERDRYGFSLANFNHMDGQVHANSFAFPLHCQQVFFSDDLHRHGWKVVCRTNVRGRRVQVPVQQPNPGVTNIGDDADFVGLQPDIDNVM